MKVQQTQTQKNFKSKPFKLSHERDMRFVYVEWDERRSTQNIQIFLHNMNKMNGNIDVRLFHSSWSLYFRLCVDTELYLQHRPLDPQPMNPTLPATRSGAIHSFRKTLHY